VSLQALPQPHPQLPLPLPLLHRQAQLQPLLDLQLAE